MPFPITSAQYPAVRAALDVSLDATTLPDATIGLAIYAGAAAVDVKRRDPAWATRTGDALQRLENAQVLFTAALLAPAVPAIEREQMQDYSYTRSKVDWTARAATLIERANEELAAVVTPTATTPGRPAFFSVAHGGRGR